mgnify:CR=1 FL=1
MNIPRALFSFHGGIHVHGHKEISTQLPVDVAPIPPRLVLPLQQHIGLPAEPLVAIGDKVLKGQPLAKPKGYISASLHAPTSGQVVDVSPLPVPHPSGLGAPCIVLESDGQDTWYPHQGLADWASADPNLLRTLIRDAGIVGLGGAGFPSSVKLQPGPSRPIRTLILNGAECEPYITSDDLLMRRQAAEIIEGMSIMARILQPTECLIGIEDNKPEAYQALREAAQGHPIEVVQVPTRYPMGGEKQLIKVLTGREVPSGGLPSQVGVVCHNVATAHAVYRAVVHGEPLISRLLTLTGGAVAQPRNVEVRLGTPVSFLLQHYQVSVNRIERLIMGGPMMGFALSHDQVPVVKTSNCLLCAVAGEVPANQDPQACIRCGACTTVCPTNLLPQQMYWHARARDFDKVQQYNLFDCIECGCCAEVCPSRIPLVQYYRFAKSEVAARERDKQRADLARRRNEARVARFDREKAEKAAKLAQAKAAAASAPPGADKKAAIDAAVARAAAKKATAPVTPKNTEDLTPAQQAQIAEADSRRAADQPGDPR